MIVVGFVSSYCEGRLVRGAIESLLEVGLDALYVYEGPAGPALEREAELPSELWHEQEWAASLVLHTRSTRESRVVIHRGRWRTDARKRNDWLQRAKREFPHRDAWAVVVDADELLVNGRYLRDRLEWIIARDAHLGADVRDASNPPMARWPLRLVEQDGSLSLITARVFRLDLIRSIDHSSSVVTNVAGVRDGWGNYAETSRLWIEGWLRAIDRGQMIAWPPFTTEPHLVHRSNLRHPLRAGLRMSEQEAEEFARALREEQAAAS